MLSPPVPFQGLGDRRLLVFATPSAMAGQTLGIALAGEHGVENLPPRLPVHSADDLRQCEVHLLQGLLPRLHGSRGHGHQQTALPQRATQDTDLVLGTKGPLESARGVELLPPLTVPHIRLASWHLTRVMGLHQLDVNPTLFEHCEQGNPGDSGGRQHDGLHLTLPPPGSQGVESSRTGPKAPPPLRIAIRGHGHPMGVGPASNPGGMERHLRSRR
jgi:hypothetical protein